MFSERIKHQHDIDSAEFGLTSLTSPKSYQWFFLSDSPSVTQKLRNFRITHIGSTSFQDAFVLVLMIPPVIPWCQTPNPKKWKFFGEAHTSTLTKNPPPNKQQRLWRFMSKSIRSTLLEPSHLIGARKRKLPGWRVDIAKSEGFVWVLKLLKT